MTFYDAFLSDIRDNLEDAFHSRAFPLYLLIGGAILDALFHDVLWLIGGVLGFLFFAIFRKNE